jgi:hypothetical protein
MDDGDSASWSMFKSALTKRNIPGSVPLIVERYPDDRSGASGLNGADLRKLQDQYGWEFSNHAFAQAIHDTAGQSVTAIEADLLKSKAWLRQQGLHTGIEDYSLSPGVGAPLVEGAMKDMLRRHVRSIRPTGGVAETLIPADPLHLRSYQFIGQSIATLQANFLGGPGTWIIFSLHRLQAGATNNGLTMGMTNFETLLDWFIAQGFQFRTRSAVIERR